MGAGSAGGERGAVVAVGSASGVASVGVAPAGWCVVVAAATCWRFFAFASAFAFAFALAAAASSAFLSSAAWRASSSACALRAASMSGWGTGVISSEGTPAVRARAKCPKNAAASASRSGQSTLPSSGPVSHWVISTGPLVNGRSQARSAASTPARPTAGHCGRSARQCPTIWRQ